MVFVFGIDLPLLEMLFIYVILILFALVIVLIEIAKLRKLLMIERGMAAGKPAKALGLAEQMSPLKMDTKRPKMKEETEDKSMADLSFSDMQNVPEKKGLFSSFFGKKESFQATGLASSFPQSQVNDLKKYIKNCLKNGFTNEEIKDILLKTGWPKGLVEAELGKS